MKLNKLCIAAVGFAIAGSAMASTTTLKGNFVKTTLTDRGVMNSLIYDPTGTQNFIPSTDYVAPGTPFEGFGVRYTGVTGGGVFVSNSNSGGQQIATLGAGMTLLSGGTSGGSASWTGQYGNDFTVTQLFSFSNTDQRVNITTTLTALSSLVNVRVSRAVDPDPDNYSGGTAATNNQRGIVSPAVPKTDFVGSIGQISGRPLGLYYNGSLVHNAGIFSSCCSETNPDSYLAGGNMGDSSSGDNGIGLGFLLGDMASGASTSWSYAYVMGGSLGTIDIPTDPSGVPEPGTLALLGLAGVAMAGMNKRRNKASA